ncbi:MAG: SPOR domain-containing protein [Sphingomonadaceae bacterium]|nr:SPOR domain-containing protein [Sphingomonadaceae bacterium]
MQAAGIRKIRHIAMLRGALAALAGCWPAAVVAQEASQAVVQPLPPPAVQDLNDALTRLARNTRDVDALVDAGTAALRLGDVEGAIGFFGRADELSPGNARVKAGLAGAFVRSERPIEALRLFAEAEKAGASTLELDGERGLAFDLVGDNASAQAHYRRALAQREDPETRRRLALSQAISGDRQGFEATLLPLLQKGDRTAYRTRAFGLAVLGQEGEAVQVANQAMPADLAQRISPYLTYMPRLTRPQQAAAGNLGIFPKAAQIGRDDPRIAAYSGPGSRPSPVRGADQRLAPAGEPLGPREDTRSGRRRPGRASSSVEKVEAARDPAPAVKEQPAARREEPRRVARAELPAVTPAVTPEPKAPPKPEAKPTEPPAQATPAPKPEPKPVVAEPVPPPAPPEPPKPSISVAAPDPQPAAQPETIPVVKPAAPEPQPARVAANDFDLGKLPGATASTAPTEPVARPEPVAQPAAKPAAAEPMPEESKPAVVTPPAPVPATAAPAPVPVVPSEPEPQEPASVADAFADFSLPNAAKPAPARGAVDITKIKPPREKEEPPKAKEPEKPKHPSRIWVQLATGRDRDALRFDWRRFERKAGEIIKGKGPFITPWGQANRLLAGPFASSKAASEAMSKLKEEGIETFSFTSPEGQEIEELK